MPYKRNNNNKVYVYDKTIALLIKNMKQNFMHVYYVWHMELGHKDYDTNTEKTTVTGMDTKCIGQQK